MDKEQQGLAAAEIAAPNGLVRRGLRPLALLLLAAGLLALFFRGTDLGAIGASLRAARPSLVGAAVVTMLGSYFLRSLRWKYLLAPVGAARLGRCFVATVVGFTVNFLVPPGRLGEIVRPYLLARHEGLSASAAFATVFLERVLDLMTVVLLVGAWLLLGPAPSGARSAEAVAALQMGGLVAFGGSALGLAVLFALVRHRDRLAGPLARLAARLPRRIGAAAGRFGSAFAVGLGVLVDAANLVRSTVLSVLLWGNIALSIWLCLRAFDIALPFGGTFLVIGFLTVGVAVPTPGAVGGYHVMCALALTLLFGVDDGRAKAAALVAHAISFVPVSALGLVFFAREGLTFEKVKSIGGAK